MSMYPTAEYLAYFAGSMLLIFLLIFIGYHTPPKWLRNFSIFWAVLTIAWYIYYFPNYH